MVTRTLRARKGSLTSRKSRSRSRSASRKGRSPSRPAVAHSFLQHEDGTFVAPNRRLSTVRKGRNHSQNRSDLSINKRRMSRSKTSKRRSGGRSSMARKPSIKTGGAVSKIRSALARSRPRDTLGRFVSTKGHLSTGRTKEPRSLKGRSKKPAAAHVHRSNTSYASIREKELNKVN